MNFWLHEDTTLRDWKNTPDGYVYTRYYTPNSTATLPVRGDILCDNKGVAEGSGLSAPIVTSVSKRQERNAANDRIVVTALQYNLTTETIGGVTFYRHTLSQRKNVEANDLVYVIKSFIVAAADESSRLDTLFANTILDYDGTTPLYPEKVEVVEDPLYAAHKRFTVFYVRLEKQTNVVPDGTRITTYAVLSVSDETAIETQAASLYPIGEKLTGDSSVTAPRLLSRNIKHTNGAGYALIELTYHQYAVTTVTLNSQTLYEFDNTVVNGVEENDVQTTQRTFLIPTASKATIITALYGSTITEWDSSVMYLRDCSVQAEPYYTDMTRIVCLWRKLRYSVGEVNDVVTYQKDVVIAFKTGTTAKSQLDTEYPTGALLTEMTDSASQLAPRLVSKRITERSRSGNVVAELVYRQYKTTAGPVANSFMMDGSFGESSTGPSIDYITERYICLTANFATVKAALYAYTYSSGGQSLFLAKLDSQKDESGAFYIFTAAWKKLTETRSERGGEIVIQKEVQITATGKATIYSIMNGLYPKGTLYTGGDSFSPCVSETQVIEHNAAGNAIALITYRGFALDAYATGIKVKKYTELSTATSDSYWTAKRTFVLLASDTANIAVLKASEYTSPEGDTLDYSRHKAEHSDICPGLQTVEVIYTSPNFAVFPVGSTSVIASARINGRKKICESLDTVPIPIDRWIIEDVDNDRIRYQWIPDSPEDNMVDNIIQEVVIRTTYLRSDSSIATVLNLAGKVNSNAVNLPWGLGAIGTVKCSKVVTPPNIQSAMSATKYFPMEIYLAINEKKWKTTTFAHKYRERGLRQILSSGDTASPYVDRRTNLPTATKADAKYGIVWTKVPEQTAATEVTIGNTASYSVLNSIL